MLCFECTSNLTRAQFDITNYTLIKLRTKKSFKFENLNKNSV